MKLLVYVVLASIFSGALFAGAPNVILIMADDLGYGDVSCYGSKLNRTPVLDKMASEGVKLTDYHSGSTVCTPSRMALMTGMYPPRVGWKGGVLGYKMKMSGGLSAEARTMAEVFKDAGYRTGISGKWHLGDAPERLPQGQGFEHAFYVASSNNQTKKLWRNGKLIAEPFNNRRLSEEFTKEAISFIKKERTRPFFLYMPYTAPHFPVEAHPDWNGKSANKAYGDVVEELDARLGEILKSLRELEIEKETIVIFTSDNGPQGGRKNKTVADPYRGGKWSVLEGGTRVPCVISWPGKLPKGKVCKELVASIDLLPSLATACGIELEKKRELPLDGVSVWNTLKGDEGPHLRKDMLYWDGWAVPQAIRVGPWKLYFDQVKEVKGSKEGPVLIDLSTDIAEEEDFSEDHPDRVDEMLALARKRLEAIKAKSISLGGEPQQFPKTKMPRWLVK